MYGAYWCPHCQEQKEMFGNAFEEIRYVECSLPNRAGQTELCKRLGINAYPSWEFSDKSRVEGVLDFAQLEEKTGCRSVAEK